MSTLKSFFRRLYYVLLLMLLINFANAQTDINTSFSTRMNYIFEQLEKNRVPNGLLLDYAMEFTNLSNFNGTVLTDSNKVMTSEFWEIYNTLYLSRIHPNGFTIQNPAVFDSVWFNQREYGKIVLTGLFFNYSRFKDNATQNNLISVQNDQVKDRYVSGVWQNPYQTEKVFALSPSIEFYEGKNLQVILPSNLWQTNAASEVGSISINFDDGQGYRTATVGQPLSLNYADTGNKVWTYRLNLINGQYLYSHSQVRIKNAIVGTGCSNCRFGETNPETIPFTADEAFDGIAGRGFITIRYRDADLGLRRPLIVVEGFDAGHIASPELQFGTTTIDNFINDNVLTSFSTDLQDALVNFPEYDIIYVDWRNGTDFLQRNGLLLQTIIRWVNNNKEQLPGGGFADNVVLGQSMGGVIARWALRDMETRLGQQHHTRMFISMDAPQQGANVPASYQHLARHMRNIYLQTNVWGIVEIVQLFTGGPSPLRVLSLADRPASRQMLINWVNGSGSTDNTWHEQWQTELRNLGYPTQNNIRNIAISNGAECGTTQPFSPGAELLNINGKANTRFLGDLVGQVAFPMAGTYLGQGGFYLGVLPGRNDIKYEFIANAQPNQGVSQRIYRGKISYTKTILWFIPITISITERNNNNNVNLLPYDYYGGGEINTGVNISDINIQNALVKFNMNFSHIPTFSFIPTPSALDIGFNNVPLNNADYLARYIGGAPPLIPRNTPFQNFVTAFNNQRINEQHIGFFQRNGDWLAQELTQMGNPPLNPPVANCSAFCENGAITGTTKICTSQTLTAPFGIGATYVWTVNDPYLVTLTPNGNTVLVTRNGTASGTAVVSVNISGACGNINLSAPITVGPPSINFVSFSNGANEDMYFCTSHTGNQFDYQLSSVPANGSIEYRLLDYPNLNVVYTHPISYPIGSSPISVGSGFSPGWYVLEIKLTTPCGSTDWMRFEVEFVNCAQMRKTNYFRVQASPNPTSSDLYVTIDEEKQEVKSLSTSEKINFVLYDFSRERAVKNWDYLNNQKQHKLNVAGIRPGQYILVVTKGKYRQSTQIIIK